MLKPLAPDWGVTIVRVMMGIILVVASGEKFSAGGLFGFIGAVTNLGFPVPQFFGVFVPLLELIGGLLIILGLGTRWVALLFVCEFVINAFLLKVPRPAPFGGWDSMRIDLMMLAAALMLALVGPGELALDRVLSRRRSTEQAFGRARPSRVSG
jgi:putative oxidoreductase